MSRSDRSFAHRLAQSKTDIAYNAALWNFRRSMQAATHQAPKAALWVRIKNRLLDIWEKVKEYVND